MFGGEPRGPVARGAGAWERHYGGRRALNLGFGWDRTQNVLWRLEHGELDGLSPRAVVVLIGTNNLAHTACARRNSPEEIAAGVRAVCAAVRERAPDAGIVLVGLLPRRTRDTVGVLREINRRLAVLAEVPGVVWLDPDPVFAGDGGLARPALMHDDIHPGPAGYRALAAMLEPELRRLLGDG